MTDIDRMTKLAGVTAPAENTAEALLREIIAAWDQPTYGETEARVDNVFDSIEKARAFLKAPVAEAEEPKAEPADNVVPIKNRKPMTPEQKEATKKRLGWPMQALVYIAEAKLKIMQANIAAGEDRMTDALKLMVEAREGLAWKLTTCIDHVALSMMPAPDRTGYRTGHGAMEINAFIRKKTGLMVKR